MYFCAAKRQRLKLKHFNHLPANPSSNPQTPTSQFQKTQNGHNLEKVKSVKSPCPRAQDRGPALRRVQLCGEGGTLGGFSADTVTPLPPPHPQLPVAWGLLPIESRTQTKLTQKMKRQYTSRAPKMAGFPRSLTRSQRNGPCRHKRPVAQFLLTSRTRQTHPCSCVLTAHLGLDHVTFAVLLRKLAVVGVTHEFLPPSLLPLEEKDWKLVSKMPLSKSQKTQKTNSWNQT